MIMNSINVVFLAFKKMLLETYGKFLLILLVSTVVQADDSISEVSGDQISQDLLTKREKLLEALTPEQRERYLKADPEVREAMAARAKEQHMSSREDESANARKGRDEEWRSQRQAVLDAMTPEQRKAFRDGDKDERRAILKSLNIEIPRSQDRNEQSTERSKRRPEWFYQLSPEEQKKVESMSREERRAYREQLQ